MQVAMWVQSHYKHSTNMHQNTVYKSTITNTAMIQNLKVTANKFDKDSAPK
jgi:hypothetical protein